MSNETVAARLGDDAMDELEQLVEQHEQKAIEDKWRKRVVERLRAVADKIERGGRFPPAYYDLDGCGIESADGLEDAISEFQDGESEGDQWGLAVAMQWRVLEVKP